MRYILNNWKLTESNLILSIKNIYFVIWHQEKSNTSINCTHINNLKYPKIPEL